MKKIFYVFCLALVAGFACLSVANAGKHHKGGGYQNSAMPVSTVAEVLVMEDDAPVKVSGKLTKQVKGDKYQLEDPSGTIIVEIESEAWNGNTITETDEIIIYGEVDKDMSKTEIDAKSVMKKDTHAEHKK